MYSDMSRKQPINNSNWKKCETENSDINIARNYWPSKNRLSHRGKWRCGMWRP